MKKTDIRTFFRKENIRTPDQDKWADERTGAPETALHKETDANNKNLQENIPFNEESASHASDLGSLNTGPARPKITFPRTKDGDRSRCFSANYYEKFSWLEYSVEQDKVFCFVCRMFWKKNIRNQNEKFLHTGINKWKKLSELLPKHEQSDIHKESSEMYAAYKKSISSGTVLEKVVQQNTDQVAMNRNNMLKLIDIILCLVRQGLPLRGHREDTTSKNRGNFLEIAELFAKYDSNFESHLEQQTNYCSPAVQNQIIEIITQLTLKEIKEEVRHCGFFALMADEARCYKDEQLALVIRYITGLKVEERFLGFIDCSASRDAEGLAKIILGHLKNLDLEDEPVIAQSYDGASVMSGKHKGLQSIIKLTHPQAIYIHCLAHRLNLVVVDSCSNVSSAVAFFNTIETLYSHFTDPGRHARYKDIQSSLGVKSQLEIGSLSSTRWACRYENCKSLMENFAAIKATLEEEVSSTHNREGILAIGLLNCISKPEFIVCLFILKSVLSQLNVLSKYFQKSTATLGQAFDLVENTISSFQNERNNFETIWNEIEAFAENNEISLEPKRIPKRKRQPEKLNDFIIESSIGKNQAIDLPLATSTANYWKINIYYQIMDNVILNFRNRFDNLPLAKSVDSFMKLDLKSAEDFISSYKTVLNIDIDLLKSETAIVKNMLKNKGVEIDMHVLISEVREDYFPNIFKLLQVALTIPISSAHCERSFSAMRRIKNWLRSSMTQDRFSNLAILSIESSLVKYKISAESVLNEFIKKNRMLKLI